jgi:hypothetical protein
MIDPRDCRFVYDLVSGRLKSIRHGATGAVVHAEDVAGTIGSLIEAPAEATMLAVLWCRVAESRRAKAAVEELKRGVI